MTSYPPPPAHWRETEVLLAAAMPSFVPRPAQAEAVRRVCDALDHHKHIALDLPTGSGKTWISLYAAERAKGRTIISTATKALQAQARDKDIPALQAAGVLTRPVVVLEGRGNFACGARVAHELPRANPAAVPVLEALQALLKEEGQSARRDDLPMSIPDWVWASICSDGDACRALECSKKGGCAYTAIRNEARAADIIIVNHHVLMADAAIKAAGALAWGKRPPAEDEQPKPAILGAYQNLIVDEAHALESAVESFGERKITIRGIQALATRVSRLVGSGMAVASLAEATEAVQDAIKMHPHGALIRPNPKMKPVLAEAAAAVKLAAEDLRHQTDYDKAITADILHSLCIGLVDRMTDIDSALRDGKDGYGLRAPSFTEHGITSQLVDVAPWLTEHLWNNVPTVLMSGTLAVPGRRDYVSERLGLNPEGGTTMLPTVFDLAKQRLVYVTPRVDSKDPKILSARCGDADVREIRDLLEASEGRALVLFPAMTDLRYVYERLEGVISHTLLAQGITTDGVTTKGRGKAKKVEPVPASPARLAHRFTEDTSSVLLATRSFMEGIDVPGETCSLVIIARFPNLRPDDPLTMARRLQIEAKGGNAWTQYQEPAMGLITRQAAGRAIRRVDDRGIVAFIDPRCGTKNYAKKILMSMKPSDFTSSLDDVAKFLTA